MEAFLLEKVNAKLVTLPVDANTAAITGARVSMKGCERIAFVVQMGDSTSALASFALKQHSAASGGTTKALSVANPYFHKKAALTVFTKVEPTVAADTYDLSSIFADDEGVVVFEVLAEDLDVQNDFAWASLDVADSTAAKLISILAVCTGLKNKPGYGQAI